METFELDGFAIFMRRSRITGEDAIARSATSDRQGANCTHEATGWVSVHSRHPPSATAT